MYVGAWNVEAGFSRGRLNVCDDNRCCRRSVDWCVEWAALARDRCIIDKSDVSCSIGHHWNVLAVSEPLARARSKINKPLGSRAAAKA